MSSQHQPSWNTAAAAAYYAYATQAAASAPPTAPAASAANPVDSATAQFVGKISQYWDALPEAQRDYFLAAVQNSQPPPATESDRLGLAKLMAFQYYEQYQAQQHQAVKNPTADAATAMAVYQQQVQQQQQQLQLQQQQLAYQSAQMQPWAQPVTSPFVAYQHQQQQYPSNNPYQPAAVAATSKRSASPFRASKGSADNASSAAPWRSSSASSSPNVTRSSATSRSSMHGAPTDSKLDRKKQMGDFVREMLTLLKASPPACADYVKEKLKPLGHAFLHDANPAPLPGVRAFVTGAIAEYKRQHLLTNPTLSNHHSHGNALSHAPAAYGPSRPMTLKPPTFSSSSSLKFDSTSRTSSQPSSHNLHKPKSSGATSYAAAAAASASNDQFGPLTTKKRKNAPQFNPDASYSSASHTDSSASTYSFTSTADPLDAEELKKREREQRFKSAEQRLAAERAAAHAMARANLAHYQEVHRAARSATANGEGGGAGGDDGGFGDDPENEHGDLDDVVVGTSQALEKPFLRLTSAPDPTEVRPLPVLEKALVHLMNRWRESRDYRFMCDQLKSVRQDLLVQRIQNELTVKVYELHARIALEMGDMSEFNQCQTQLKILYERGVAGCHAEFLAYRILYFLFTKSRRDMKLLLSTLTPSDRANHYVAQALAVRAATQRGDYLTFFELYRNADLLMGTYLLDPMMDRERAKGLWTMTKSHMTVRMDRIVRQLAWDDAAQARVFINRVVDQVCDARCVQPVPKDRSEYKVQEGAEVVEGKKIRVMMEAWLVAFTKVDIKGQLD